MEPDLLKAVHELDESRVRKLDRVATYEEKARLLRSHFSFAVCIMHEICHALNMFSKDWLPDTGARVISAAPNPTEPFYNGQRIAELGFAFGNVLLSGLTDAMGSWDDRLTEVAMQPFSSVPYSMDIKRWPGRNTHAPSLGTAAEYGRKWWQLQVLHPVRWHGIRLPGPDLEPGKMVVSTPEPETPEPVKFNTDIPPPATEAEAEELREYHKTVETDAEELEEYCRTRASGSPDDNDDRGMA